VDQHGISTPRASVSCFEVPSLLARYHSDTQRYASNLPAIHEDVVYYASGVETDPSHCYAASEIDYLTPVPAPEASVLDEVNMTFYGHFP